MIEEELRVDREQKIAKMKAKANLEALAAAQYKKSKSTKEAVKIKKERADEERRVSKRRKYTDAPTEVVSLISDDEDKAPSVRDTAKEAEKVAPSVEKEVPRVVEEDDLLFVPE
jgi:hypothetical protein